MRVAGSKQLFAPLDAACGHSDLQAEGAATSYYPSIDSVRVFAILAVICIHTDPFAPSPDYVPTALDDALSFLIQNAALFAVPFFFTAAGYFHGRSCAKPGGAAPATKRFLGRTLALLAAWSLFYLVLPSPDRLAGGNALLELKGTIHNSMFYAARNVRHLVLHGGEYHLWFLSSLAMCALIAFVFIALGLKKYLLPAGAALFLFGLSGQAYSSLNPAFDLGLNTRIGPFFGLVFFATGHLASGWRNIGRFPFLLAASIGLLIQLAESAYLALQHGSTLGEYYLGTYIFAVGIFLHCLSRPGLGGTTLLPALGRFTLGVYAVHVYAITAIEPYDWSWKGSRIWQAAQPFVVYGLSLALVLALEKINFSKKYVAR